ncbi:hypothetical protein CIPAW_16G058700 [Carya illinoinensis]|uniref:Uncharacterized protein n=1 Tax=Carya illinoinensis TaxID=32201 RepID=A0A8T1N4E1_CARIL|nr:hypothetical protein CIPAW_16G058700 [Carya illinoinensis]
MNLLEQFPLSHFHHTITLGMRHGGRETEKRPCILYHSLQITLVRKEI